MSMWWAVSFERWQIYNICDLLVSIDTTVLPECISHILRKTQKLHEEIKHTVLFLDILMAVNFLSPIMHLSFPELTNNLCWQNLEKLSRTIKSKYFGSFFVNPIQSIHVWSSTVWETIMAFYQPSENMKSIKHFYSPHFVFSERWPPAKYKYLQIKYTNY